VAALARLNEVSKSEVFMKAAATVKGAGAGVKRFGVNLGRKAKRAADFTGQTQGPREQRGVRPDRTRRAGKGSEGEGRGDGQGGDPSESRHLPFEHAHLGPQPFLSGSSF
jgi:hypothetical protein